MIYNLSNWATYELEDRWILKIQLLKVITLTKKAISTLFRCCRIHLNPLVLGWIGVEFSSSSILIHPNTYGLISIPLHANKALVGCLAAKWYGIDHWVVKIVIWLKIINKSAKAKQFVQVEHAYIGARQWWC